MGEAEEPRGTSARVPVKRVDSYVWEIPQSYKSGMRVVGRVYSDEALMEKMRLDLTLEQCANVAHLPGIYKWAVTLPDGHEGYGFPIGGVAATDYEEGVLSPGGVGYDINCGVRLLRTDFDERDVVPLLGKLLETLFDYIPSGLGSKGRIGCMKGADPSKVSPTAKNRGLSQVGSLGSGNHFLEIEKVDRVFDEGVAKSLGINRVGQVLVLIHTGSRGFGHQVCSDYIRVMERAVQKYGIRLPDRELACAPAKTPEVEDYFAAMSAACNYAWTNRQLITHWTRQAFERLFRRSAEDMDMHLIYDVAHNIAKVETHRVNGEKRKVFVHRKGATRAFPKGHPEVPAEYRDIGQPVLIPGSMGTSSWVLVGNPKAMELSFGSTAHGAGRFMSRAAAKRKFWGSDVQRDLEQRGIPCTRREYGCHQRGSP